jgi:hypothetical protein
VESEKGKRLSAISDQLADKKSIEKTYSMESAILHNGKKWQNRYARNNSRRCP